MATHNIGQMETLLKNGELKKIELEDKPIVVARVDDEYHAVAGECTHYHAPLEKGVLKGHTLICPWHHACFDVRSGLRTEPPALNDLAHYDVQINDGGVMVTLPSEKKGDSADGQTTDTRVFVVVGGGAAGNMAVEELRRQGFAGRILLISATLTVPIDRPNLSKDYLAGKAQPDWIPLRDEAWYADHDIELRLNTRVTGVDLDAHTLSVEGGDPIGYDKLLLATGGKPRQLRDVPGTDLGNVFLLRELADADRIIEAIKPEQKVVVIGASFIGMEAAASLTKGRGLSVTVVGLEAIPFERVLGADIGRMLQKAHEDNGVQFRLSSDVKALTGSNGKMEQVELKSGEVLPADIVLVGVGVQPATDFLNSSGITLNEKDKAVRVSETLQASHADVYAAGDIARWGDGAGTRVEHWRLAQQHGMIAARNMLGGSEAMSEHVPFFWTAQFGVNVRYVGHAEGWDEIIVRGSVEGKEFVAFYVKDGALLAAAGVKHDPDMDAIEFILRDKMPLTPEQMRDQGFDLVKYAKGE